MKLRVSLLVALLLTGALAQTTGVPTCRGKQDYRLEIQMRWGRSNDVDFDASRMSVGFVFAVVHTQRFRLFEPLKPLAEAQRHLIKEGKGGPLLDWLKKLRANAQDQVHSFDHVTSASNRDTIKLNVRMDGDKGGGSTYLSFMGHLKGTPDYFFGFEPLNLCENGNFTKRFPKERSEWVKGYDAGLDERAPKPRVVTVDSRPGLQAVQRYAMFTLVQGSYDGHFAFWKILVIVGVLACALLTAFICLYPVCCKKQMLDVPVPLQNEAQWAT